MPTTPPTLPFDQPDPLAPPPAYARLRADSPVAPVLTPEGRPAWLVTSYDTAATVLADPRFLLSPPGSGTEHDWMVQDGEAHARLRRLVSKAFTHRTVGALRPRVEQAADEHLTAAIAVGSPADLVADYAAPLAIDVIGELLGVAIGGRTRFRQLADAASAADPFAAGAAEDPLVAWQALGEYVGGLVADKRANQGDDLLSRLIAVRDADDDRLSDDELLAMATMLIANGYLTVCNAVSVGALQLIDGGWLATSSAADATEFDAIAQEVLRLQIGLIGEPFPRFAQEDVELAGASVASGDMLLVRLGAANRDQARFADPDLLRPGRDDGRALTFGHGPHHCLGAALGRLEVTVALHTLVRRLPHLRLEVPVTEITWARSHADAGPTAVPVVW